MNNVKINELRQWMAQHQVELAYISDPGHIAYFSGYESDPHERVLALFIPLEQDPFLFTPALEVEDAQNSSWAYDVRGYLDSENPWEIIGKELRARYGQPGNVGIEKNALTVERFDAISDILTGTDSYTDLTSIIQRLQLIKTLEEKDKLIEAGKWADVAFEIGFKAVKDGVTEQAIIAEIEYQLKKQGVSQMSFDTLVLAGANAASPHGTPGNTKISPNELVLFDLGVVWNGYCSDATRTIAYQKPTDFQEKIYNITLEAQLAAQEAVRPGVTAGELDQIARNVINSYGYGEYFNHRLGHGIGTTVHEFPSLVEGNDLVIEEGMCFSLEPGIYIPEKVGVRIEDCVYVTSDGCVPFTTTPKELLVLEK
ncbi:TPA: aminopeptidase P family protein [Enterococcus faecium]|uniref:aminopeptidase P family protein n=1 Tax=Enterococcus faecium TaxID=1352 RepID=UPI00100E76D0|nr:Xaa-Pro peptidase family protein [Enterococcus faecium]EGP4989425.1 aminopeptidase P family protein [Enterococcus faecium]EHG8744858.1 aminopeptidase P family protein [Enterococcus faecium]EME3438673.1 aminopeptidase P family protein [Enterococcus faecium]MCL6154079.1 aminopeptidase P family protein [Enterococcus faecium]MDV7715996.1 Xaa-Pro peptidase family protein [Enterococcus faecium]